MAETPSQFYLHLFSNTSSDIFEDNTKSSFIVKLPEVLNLKTYEYEVEVKPILIKSIL